jgi:hypothetical protein
MKRLFVSIHHTTEDEYRAVCAELSDGLFA